MLWPAKAGVSGQGGGSSSSNMAATPSPNLCSCSATYCNTVSDQANNDTQAHITRSHLEKDQFEVSFQNNHLLWTQNNPHQTSVGALQLTATLTRISMTHRHASTDVNQEEDDNDKDTKIKIQIQTQEKTLTKPL